MSLSGSAVKALVEVYALTSREVPKLSEQEFSVLPFGEHPVLFVGPPEPAVQTTEIAFLKQINDYQRFKNVCTIGAQQLLGKGREAYGVRA